ncbi:SH3 domain-containing protein [Marinivivus vitaminiproducens]|uniref:SH3 domain-containing protein n=1 Tax=Marinivivus vitaminiproducens TaxID=3035935 RepID=UPI0027A779EE|nr:SH3 domain-containing protein [Geminicoccaceae bacterium SCSIO 64248]
MSTSSDRLEMPLRYAPACSSSFRLAVLAILALLAVPAAAAPKLGASTGLPLPRFASLGSNEINVRSGPGLRHPILWQFRQAGLPVLVRDEVAEWRLIEDSTGDEGWIHAPLLANRRTVLVQGEVRDLLRTPSDPTRVLLRLEPGVIGELESCPDDWCRIGVRTGGGVQEGWLRRGAVWGLLEGEVVD